MTTDHRSTRGPSIRQLSDAEVRDPALAAVIQGATTTKAPPASWYRTMGHNPAVAVQFARYWELLHRGGQVEHRVKELCRLQIAQLVGCEFCARQSSPPAGISEEEKASCALPNWDHPDPRTAAALHYSRTLVLDDGRDDEVYEELGRHYTDAEVVELAAFAMLTMGGNRMAKSWHLDHQTSATSGIESTDGAGR